MLVPSPIISSSWCYKARNSLMIANRVYSIRTNGNFCGSEMKIFSDRSQYQVIISWLGLACKGYSLMSLVPTSWEFFQLQWTSKFLSTLLYCYTLCIFRQYVCDIPMICLNKYTNSIFYTWNEGTVADPVSVTNYFFETLCALLNDVQNFFWQFYLFLYIALDKSIFLNSQCKKYVLKYVFYTKFISDWTNDLFLLLWPILNYFNRKRRCLKDNESS